MRYEIWSFTGNTLPTIYKTNWYILAALFICWQTFLQIIQLIPVADIELKIRNTQELN